MLGPERLPCREVRTALLARAMAPAAPAAPDPAAVHLAACEPCRDFARHLAVARGALRAADVVGPALRQRTLLALSRRRTKPRWAQLWAVPPAVVLGAVVSFALPLWLAGQLLRPFLGTSPLTVALGLAAVCSQALLASAASYLILAVNRRPAARAVRPVLEV